jgi:hypothetical protein
VRKGDQKITKHHIIPTSKDGPNDKTNIAFIKQGLHRKYHDLFSNKTPDEILSFLENYFWKGKKNFIRDYARENDKVRESSNCTCFSGIVFTICDTCLKEYKGIKHS